MAESSTRRLAERAGWYVERIDRLLAMMRDTPRMDGDDVEMCQGMLRDVLARFRADRRPTPDGHVVTGPEQQYGWAIAEANATLRITASSRPTNRWRDDLTACRTHLAAYLDTLESAAPRSASRG